MREGVGELAARDQKPEVHVAAVLARYLLQLRRDWGWLLAYADPRQVAALMRTCARLVSRLAEQPAVLK